jgi:hypothetical protein
VYAASAGAAFLIAVAPILGQTGRVMGWLGGIAVNDGKYGASRGHLFFDPSRYTWNLRLLVWAEPVAAGAAAAGALLLLHLALSGRWRTLEPGRRRIARALLFTTLAEAAQYLLVAKHYGDHYLIPGLPLAGLSVVLCFVLLRGAYVPRERRALLLAAAIALGAGVWWIGTRVLSNVRAIGVNAPGMMAIRRQSVERAAAGHALLVTEYSSSSPVYALFYADGWTGRRYRDDLGAMFPDEITIDEFTGAFARGGRPVAFEQVRAWAAGGRLWVQCNPGMRPGQFEYETIVGIAPEGLYRAIPGPEPASPAGTP